MYKIIGSLEKGWGNLCASILNSGIIDGDVEFFESERGALILDCCNQFLGMELDIEELINIAKERRKALEGDDIFSMVGM